MMDSSKVYEMAAKMNAEKNVETKESETKVNVEETKAETAEPKTAEAPKIEEKENNKADTNTPKEEVKDATKPENSDEKVVEKNERTEKNPAKKETHTKQEQIDYAFKRLKGKNKELIQRIRELEEENKKFKENYTLEDFKNNQEAYLNYLVDKKTLSNEQVRLEKEYERARKEEFEYLNAQREEKCFPNEQARESYYQARKIYGPALLKELDEVDKEGVVLGYLDDCEVAPLMLQILMTNEQYKNNVLEKHSPYSKLRALEDLENRIKYAQSELAKRNSTVPVKSEDTKPVETPKPAIPVIGSVTKSEQSSNGKIVKDYNTILHELNQKRLGRN